MCVCPCCPPGTATHWGSRHTQWWLDTFNRGLGGCSCQGEEWHLAKLPSLRGVYYALYLYRHHYEYIYIWHVMFGFTLYCISVYYWLYIIYMLQSLWSPTPMVIGRTPIPLASPCTLRMFRSFAVAVKTNKQIRVNWNAATDGLSLRRVF